MQKVQVPVATAMMPASASGLKVAANEIYSVPLTSERTIAFYAGKFGRHLLVASIDETLDSMLAKLRDKVGLTPAAWDTIMTNNHCVDRTNEAVYSE